MARIYRATDRIKVKIDGITVTLAPLTIHQKTEVQEAMVKGRVKQDLKELTRGVVLSLKHSIKDVQGLENGDGSPYNLVIEDGMVSDECINDLLNIELSKKLTLICAALVNGIPSEFTNETGEPMSGVEMLKTGDVSPN